MNNKTSVLMAVYFKEEPAFLDLAIKSILENQTKKPDEFILVCDGPLTELLDNVISKYEKTYPLVFKVYRTDENQGLGKALNYGLSKCTNEIIIRADSDDVCVPERIEKQVAFLNLHPDIAIVSSHIDEFDSDWKKPKNTKKMPLTNEELISMAKFRNPINHMAVAFRKEVITNIGSYRHIPYVEDYELWVRAIVNGYKLSNIDDILVHARVGNGMIKRRGNRLYINSWKQLNCYMLDNKMITRIEFVRNMVSVIIFVYMPTKIKGHVYNRVLRNRNQQETNE